MVQERLSAAPVGLEIRTYTLKRFPKEAGVGAGCFWGLWYLCCLKAGTKAKGLSWDFSAPPPLPKPLWLNIDRKLVMFWVLPLKIWPGNQMKLDFGSVKLFCTNEYPIPEKNRTVIVETQEWNFKPNFQCRCDRLLCLVNCWGFYYYIMPHFLEVPIDVQGIWLTCPAGVCCCCC